MVISYKKYIESPINMAIANSSNKAITGELINDCGKVRVSAKILPKKIHEQLQTTSKITFPL